MINEEKIKLMTKLASYEQREGRKAFFMNKLFKRDYVSVQMIKTAAITTISYFILLFLWVVFEVDYFMKNISTINIIAMGVIIIIIYVLFMVFYLILAYYYYTRKYKQIKKNLIEYNENLKALHKMYKNESKNKEDKSPGGIDRDVETFST